MVGLDAGFTLEDVRPDGSLCKELDAVELSGFFSENIDELFADDVAFLLRVGHTGQLVEEAVCRVHIDQVGVHLVPENLDDLLRLALSEQTVVDMYTDELLADGLDQHRCDDRGINAAREREQDFLVPDLLPESRKLFLNKCICQFRSGDPLHGIGSSVIDHAVSSCIV